MPRINRLTASGIAVENDVVVCDCTSGAITVTLPDATSGTMIAVKKVDTTANAVTITAAGGWTVSASAGTLKKAQDAVILYADNAQQKWHTFTSAYAQLATLFTGTTQTVNTVAASGAAQTIPAPTVATFSAITMTASCTFTFPVAAAGTVLTAALTQGGLGSFTATWPTTATMIWPAATAPTLTTTVGKSDLLQWTNLDGTHWLGKAVAQNY